MAERPMPLIFSAPGAARAVRPFLSGLLPATEPRVLLGPCEAIIASRWPGRVNPGGRENGCFLREPFVRTSERTEYNEQVDERAGELPEGRERPDGGGV